MYKTMDNLSMELLYTGNRLGTSSSNVHIFKTYVLIKTC